MSKIPYTFHTPIPAFFYSTGYLDPNKESFENRIKFLTWAFSKCYVVPSIREGNRYDSFEFSFSRQTAAEECGLTEKAFRVQLEYHLANGFLKVLPNNVKNRCNFYKWEVQKFSEKIIPIEKSEPKVEGPTELEQGPTDSVNKVGEGPTNYREEIAVKGPTDFKKGQPKGTPKGQPFSERKEDEKGQPRGQPKGHFYRTKEQKEVCLKETKTNKNKENPSPEPIPSKDLSLFHREKDLFISSKEKELKEQKEALEAYLAFRDIKNISSKTIARWLSIYPYQDIQDAIFLMLDPCNKKIENQGGWVEKALQEGWPRKERIKKQNHKFAVQFKEKKKLHYLKVNSRYCIDMRTEKDYYYHIDPSIFETQLRNCL